MRGWLLASLGMLATACGGELADADVNRCELSFAVEGGEPVVAPATLVLSAAVRTNIVGFRELSWNVEYQGQPVDFVIRDESDSTSIEFVASVPGPYDVSLEGNVGGIGCASGSRTLNTMVPNAAATSYVLGVFPPGGSSYFRPVTVYGGADNGVGTIDIESERRQSVVVDHQGSALAAFVRFSSSDFAVTETVASAAGELEVRLGPGTYDVEVLPYDSRSPYMVRGVTVPGLPAMLQGPTPRALSISVTAGPALADARVRAAVAGGPGATGVTGISGTADLEVEPGTSLEVEIVPPSSSALPRLSASLTGQPTSLDVSYSATTTRQLSLEVVDSVGSPVPNARLHLDGSLSGAGSLDAGSGSVSMAGRYLRSLDADGAGQLGPETVPNALYTVVITAPGRSASVASLDLRTGQLTPATIVATEAGALSGTVVGPSGPVAGARVRARATGALAGFGEDGGEVATDAAGAFVVPVAVGAAYELVATSAAMPTVRAPVLGSVSGVVNLTVPSGIELVGRIKSNDVEVEGASIVLFDADSGVPVGSGSSDQEGQFVLAIPDPGTL